MLINSRSGQGLIQLIIIAMVVGLIGTAALDLYLNYKNAPAEQKTAYMLKVASCSQTQDVCNSACALFLDSTPPNHTQFQTCLASCSNTELACEQRASADTGYTPPAEPSTGQSPQNIIASESTTTSPLRQPNTSVQ
ncbi:MAG: hypothetical protein KGI60_02925 [Patescibacteria group bacterium]|nr:hypothetical protein [Patescibacteria group bacterium]